MKLYQVPVTLSISNLKTELERIQQKNVTDRLKYQTKNSIIRSAYMHIILYYENNLILNLKGISQQKMKLFCMHPKIAFSNTEILHISEFGLTSPFSRTMVTYLYKISRKGVKISLLSWEKVIY